MSKLRYHYWALGLILMMATESISAQSKSLKSAAEKPVPPHASPDMIVRISEIEIVAEHLEEYKAILKEESAESMKIEPGVISLFAMYQKESPLQVRILEIYANKEAYQSHLKTPHFLHYKTATQKMVKSLKLVDMTGFDTNIMPGIFKKLN